LAAVVLTFVLAATHSVLSVAAAGNLEERRKVAPAYEQLKRRAHSNQKVRVIARVDLDAGQRRNVAAINKAKNKLREVMARRSIPVLKQAKKLPLMIFELSEAELDELIDSGLVAQVVEDKLNKPLLGQSIPHIGGDLAHNFGLTGLGAAVAILDTGVDTDHPVFTGRIVEQACFSTKSAINGSSSLCPNNRNTQYGIGAAEACESTVDSGCYHGTHVSAIAAGQHVTYSGVAPAADIIAIQVFSRFSSELVCGTGITSCIRSYDSDMIDGLEYVESLTATYSIASVNISIGGGEYTGYCDAEPHKMAIDDLLASGVATVIASGNDGFNNAVNSPACISTAITVGATQDNNDTIKGWSNSATMVDLLAPGAWIYAAVPGGGYASKAGTSMAAPHVAGAIALLKAHDNTFSVSTMASLLATNAVSVLDAGNGLTFPRIDLASVATVLAGPTELPQLSITAPVNDAVIAIDEGPVNLVATASDSQDGDLSTSVQWVSDVDGAISSPILLTVGPHVLTASVNDSVGFSASDHIAVTVVNKPVTTIISPLNGSVFLESENVSLQASAVDVEDGDISSTTQWSSSLDGVLGVGANLSVSLSSGIHTITATVVDGEGYSPTADAVIV
jgi:subtilisin family serine protease